MPTPDPSISGRADPDAAPARGAPAAPSSSPSAAASEPLDAIVEDGTCFMLFVFSIARAVNLDEAARLVRQDTRRARVRHQRRAPVYFEYRPPPLRLTQTAEPVAVTPTHSTGTNVDLVLHEFGAVAIVYSIDLAGPLENLAVLSDALYEHEALLNDATERARALQAAVAPAAGEPELAGAVEDYAIHHVRRLRGDPDPAALVRAHRMRFAQILRSEREPLSDQEIDDAVGCQIAFGRQDLTLIDWQAAIVIDPSAEDTLAVLEFANVELLSLRILDEQLDDLLDRSYETLARRTWRDRLLFHTGDRELRRLARLQVDRTLLFEDINNALKLFGDQFLARVHRLASQRLHIGDWDAVILRKLETIENVSSKLTHHQGTRRMEALEWIIIVLIAISIAIAFIPGLSH